MKKPQLRGFCLWEKEMKKVTLVCGVGINDADYVVKTHQELPKVGGKRKRKLAWVCPYYQKWTRLIVRCYSEKFKKEWPTYKDCTMHEERLYFSKFRAWMETQDWEGKELDKDILIQGNKHYSPDTCVFVSKEVNYLFLDSAKKRGEHPIGARWCKRDKQFYAQVGINGESKYLGMTRSVEVAHRLWQEAKMQNIKEIAERQEDTRVKGALMLRVHQLSQDILNGRVTIKL